jgi:hypothetical protein
VTEPESSAATAESPEASADAPPVAPADEERPAEAAAPAADPTPAAGEGAGDDGSGNGPRGLRPWVTATTVAVLVVAIVAASAVGVLAFTSDDGAETPDGAVHAMLDAVRRNDLLGVVEQLPPGERKALRDPTARLATQIQNLRLVGRLNPAAVPGLVFTFDDVQTRTSRLADETTAVDLVGGRFTAQWLGGGQPLTEHGRQILAREWGVTIDPVDASYHRDFAEDDLRLVTVKEGGGWHVSLAYSVAETQRIDRGLSPQPMGRGPVSYGADRPEDAVTDLVRAYADSDPERLVTLLYPDEARAVYDYAPTFLPGLRTAARRAQDDGTYEVQLNDVKTAMEGSGEVRRIHLTALDVDIRDELHKQHLWWSEGCFHTDQRIDDADQPYAKTDSCSRDKPRPGDTTAIRDNPVAGLAVFGGGADLPTFTVMERNGRWFVSPTHSLLDSIADTLEKATPDDLDGFAERWADSLEAGVGQGLSGEPIRPTARDVATDPTKAGARGKALSDRCGALATGPDAPAVTAACLRRLVAHNQIRPADLPPTAQAALAP